MTIQYAILGLLSWQPLSGYDLKKIISDSDIFYWSGNNNQIYNTLVQLHKEGLVSQQVQPQENLPAKKIYSITEKGKSELRAWVLSAPEMPEIRNNFLIQLAWSEVLSDEEMDVLLTRYEEEMNLQVRMLEEKSRRPAFDPARSPRESYIWQMLADNTRITYQCQLDWVRQVRSELKSKTG